MTEYTETFEVAAAPTEAWTALVGLQAGRVDTTASPRQWWLPGFEAMTSEIDAVEASSLVVRKEEQPCLGTTIRLTFEHAATGTRISVTQSGFDEAFVEASGELFWTIARQIGEDLKLFFTTGEIAGRHGRLTASS